MADWYPQQTKAGSLRTELERLEGLALNNDYNPLFYVQKISADLAEAQRRADFPAHQTRRWIWLASQYRMNAGVSTQIASKAAAALQYLSAQLAKDQLEDSDVQNLNWVLDSAVRGLSQCIPACDLRACLGTGELARIDEFLGAVNKSAEFDTAAVKMAVAHQLGVLRTFGDVPDFANLELKVEALFAAATSNSPESRLARSALSYLAEQDDVVSDEAGLLGLVDDIYVIEWAYAAVEEYTRCLPLLEAMLRKWPYICDLPILEEGSACLGRYEQYVVCSGLHALFEDDGAGLSVVREVGPLAVITAVMVAIECARRDCMRDEDGPASWNAGDPIVIGDAVRTFKATYQGTMQIGAKTCYRLGVRDQGVITIKESILPYISRAPRPHARLSSGNEVLVWLRDRHVDPFVHLTGADRAKLDRQSCVLLVGPKHRMDEFLGRLSVLGALPQALLGLRYVDAQGRTSDYPGSASDRPLIYATHDVSSALELIRDPPDHVHDWRIVADGARVGRALYGEIETAGELSSTPVCIFVDLIDREATADLLSLGIKNIWYLEDQDVQAPSTGRRRPSDRTDPVSRFTSRIANHWSTTFVRHDVNDPFLESVAELLTDRVGNFSEDPQSVMLDFSVSAFVRKATANPLHTQPFDTEMRPHAEHIVSQCSTLRQYDARALRLYELFTDFLKGSVRLETRARYIARIATALARGETATVVCRSSQIAQKCSTAARGDPSLSRFNWMNLERLRIEAPFDCIVVPGWLDRLSMRELASNGYAARVEMLLLPFEMRWFESTMVALRRWERTLERRTAHYLKRVSDRVVGEDTPARWRSQSELRLDTGPSIDLDIERVVDEPDTEFLEARAVEALSRITAEAHLRRLTAKAQLFLLESPGAFIFLPPAGRVIVLSGLHLGTERATAEQDAERLLFRNVADLESGMIVAICVDSDRDLIDARADQFLSEAGKVREIAALWKSVLKRHLNTDEDVRVFSRNLKDAGEGRCQATIRAWISGADTIAPRGYRRMIPLLAALCDDEELRRRNRDVIKAVELIYRARHSAAGAIARELFTGEINLDAPELRFNIDGREVCYVLHKIRRVADVLDVPVELVGRIGNLADLPKAESQ